MGRVLLVCSLVVFIITLVLAFFITSSDLTTEQYFGLLATGLALYVGSHLV